MTLTNTGGLPLTFGSGAAISGTNAGDFSVSLAAANTCSGTLAAGAACSLGVTFTPQATGSRTGSLTFTDNAGGTQTVPLSGTGTAAPGGFTTYLAPYGSGSQTLTGSSTVLHLAAYNPGGAAQITQLQTYLTNTPGGAYDYYILLESNTLQLSNGSGRRHRRKVLHRTGW